MVIPYLWYNVRMRKVFTAITILIVTAVFLGGCKSSEEVSNTGQSVQTPDANTLVNATPIPYTAAGRGNSANQQSIVAGDDTAMFGGGDEAGIASKTNIGQGGQAGQSLSLDEQKEVTITEEITNVGNEKAHVIGHDVNLREGPGTHYEVIDTIGYLTTVEITGKTDGWYRIEFKDGEGFISKQFISLGAEPTPTPKPTATPKAKAKATATPKPTFTPNIDETVTENTGTDAETEASVEQGSKGNYSSDEIYIAAKLIYAEGKNQSTESFLAMANVLYNRTQSKKFGGTIEREVYRSGQFTVVKNSSFETLEPSSKALSAANAVFNEGKRVLPEGVMFFRAARLGEYWASSRKFYKTIGGNNYYY